MIIDKLAMLKESEYELNLYEQIEQAGLPLPTYHPVLWGHEWDFAWTELKILVEVQGQVWEKGAHTWGQGYIDDRARSNLAQIAGWLVLEVTPEMIHDLRALQFVKDALQVRRN